MPPPQLQASIHLQKVLARLHGTSSSKSACAVLCAEIMEAMTLGLDASGSTAIFHFRFI
jgi:hypothetical protein